MAENSNIAWTTHTFNPWIGCTKVGPGCDACYAEVWDRRFDKEHVARHWGPGAPRRRTKPQNWSKVRRWQHDRRAALDRGEAPEPVSVFCASLADVCDNEVPDEWRSDLWALIAECHNLRWILVTKRIGNVAKMAQVGGFGPNVIILSTIVTRAEADRDMGKLIALKREGIARWVGVSYEPAVEFVDFSGWLPRPRRSAWDEPTSIAEEVDVETGIDWLIVGGESAQGGAVGRPFNTTWARVMVAQCSAWGTPIFVKQLGARCEVPAQDKAWAAGNDQLVVTNGIAHFRDRCGADPAAWPEDLRVRQLPTFGRAA